MAKKETQHLLKIKKEDYPQIFDFLENVPRGTKTAHIREALLRYIEELGDNPQIPSRSHTAPSKQQKTTIKPVTETFQEKQEKHEKQNVENESTQNIKKDEEMIAIDINDI